MSVTTRRGVVAAAVIAYIAGWASCALLPIEPNDLDGFFWPSAQQAVNGHPLLVYHPFADSTYPNGNGPVSLIPLAVVGWVVRALHWTSVDARRAVVYAAFSGFSLLVAREAALVVKAARGELSARASGFLQCCVLASPPLWVAVLGYGHVEQPVEVWLTLLAVRRLAEHRTGTAGVALGLAILTRTTAVLLLIPIGVLVIRRRGWRATGGLAVSLVATVVIGVAPLYAADPGAVLHSLVTYRANLVVGGGSLSEMTIGMPLEALLQRWDSGLIAAGVLGVTALAVRRRPALDFGQPAVYGLLAATTACFALFAKTVWPYYLMEPTLWALVWWYAARPARLSWRWGVPVGLLTLANVLVNLGAEVAKVGRGRWLDSAAFGLTMLTSLVILARAGPTSTAGPLPSP